MFSKFAYIGGLISLISVILNIQVLGADINNGNFETFDYNQTYDINIPRGWQCENYTAVVSSFQPTPDGINWKINQLYPIEGQHFLLLSSGDIRPEPSYARAKQTIYVSPGDTLIGAYLFGTYDYLHWNDWAEIRLTPLSDPNLSELTIVHISVADVGNESSMKGWKRFAYTFDANQAGAYNLILEVDDAIDNIVNSYFAVDGLVLCHNASGGGDLNFDCTTDFQDFAILAKGWLCDCSNPVNYRDPNTNCPFDIDLSGNGLIDYNDLAIMSQYWLDGTRQGIPEDGNS